MSFISNIEAMYPWFDNDIKLWDDKCDEQFYSFTYGFEGDDWVMRLEDGADDDEFWRCAFVYKLCIKYKLVLHNVWYNLNQKVVCPFYKYGNIKDLHKEYISYISNEYNIDKTEVKYIWNSILNWAKSDENCPELNWVLDRFHLWVINDINYHKNKKEEKIENNKKKFNKFKIKISKSKDDKKKVIKEEDSDEE